MKALRRTGAPLLATFILFCCTTTAAQCHLPKQFENSRSTKADSTSSTTQGEPLLPESGLLSDKTYASLYFGFMLELPIPLEGHRIMLPIRLAGEHALLGIGFQNGKRYGTLEVTAGGRRDDGSHNMTPEEAQEKLDDIARSKPGPQPADRLDYQPEPVKLKRVDKHSGEVHGTRFSARIKDYMVRFTIQSNDRAFLEKARRSVENLKVFCTDTAENFYTVDGKAFTPKGSFTNGPTIPTATVDEAIRTRPAQETIPSGSYLANGAYRIPQLELSFTLPKGWNTAAAPSDNIDDPADPALAQRLNYLWQACARTLFRATSPNGYLLEFRALDQSCLGLPSPASSTDSLGSEELGEYLQMLGRFGKIKSNKTVESNGHLFSVYKGTLVEGPPAKELEHRAAQAIVATRYRKLILVWSWSAPTQSELQNIPLSNLTLGSGHPVEIGPSLANW